MEAIITIVGFLGAGKTTLLKQLVHSFIKNEWQPFVILNDYENAYLDAQQFKNQIEDELKTSLYVVQSSTTWMVFSFITEPKVSK